MYYESMYKENKAFISFIKDFVFTFKIWNNLNDTDFTTISNFYNNQNSISRVCIDIETEYTRDTVRDYLESIMISHIQKSLSKKTNDNSRNIRKSHDDYLEVYLYDILLRTL